MARFERREFDEGRVKHLLIITSQEAESISIDKFLGQPGTKVEGEVCLADGYGEHYIRLMRKEDAEEGR